MMSTMALTRSSKIRGVMVVFLMCFVLKYVNTTSERNKETRAGAGVGTPGNNQTKALRFIVHVGLPKTGTTTIQLALDTTLYDSLTKDGYYYLGKPGHKKEKNIKEKESYKNTFMIFAKNRHNCLLPPPGWVQRYGRCKIEDDHVQAFIQKLRDHYEQGHNLIVSVEGLSMIGEDRIQFMAEVIREGFYEPTIVVSNRLYHDWVVSWIQMYFRAYKWAQTSYNTFGGKSGAVIPTLSQFLEDPMQFTTNCHIDHCDWFLETGRHPASVLVERYKRSFNDTVVFQMNQDGDMPTNFICQILPDAAKTCEELQAGSLQVSHTNGAASPFKLEYEMLAQAAFQEFEALGHFVNNRRRFVDRIERYHQRISNCPLRHRDYSCERLKKFPLRCLNKSEKQILARKTVEFEKDVSGAPEEGEAATSLYGVIIEDLGKDKFCWIDTVKVLEDVEWADFFASGANIRQRN